LIADTWLSSTLPIIVTTDPFSAARLAEAGVSVLVLHHPRKGAVLWGQAARGSGALPAFADISLEMYLCDPADPQNRRRRLLGFSHHEQTPRQLVLELNAEGTDYRVLAGEQPDAFQEQWSQLRLILEDANDKWNGKRILERWSDDFPRPANNTLWRWLRRAVALGLRCPVLDILRAGEGPRDAPVLPAPGRKRIPVGVYAGGEMIDV
jgi:hypothetical protein